MEKLISIGMEQGVLDDICEMRSSAEANDSNSWKSALHRGMEKAFPKVKA